MELGIVCENNKNKNISICKTQQQQSLCVWFLLVVNTSASDCLERLIPKMIYYVLRGTLNSTHSVSMCCTQNYYTDS